MFVKLYNRSVCQALQYKCLSSSTIQVFVKLYNTSVCHALQYKCLSSSTIQVFVKLYNTGVCQALQYKCLSSSTIQGLSSSAIQGFVKLFISRAKPIVNFIYSDIGLIHTLFYLFLIKGVWGCNNVTEFRRTNHNRWYILFLFLKISLLISFTVK